MAPKKNKAKKPSKSQAQAKQDYWLHLTQQIAQLFPKNITPTKKITLHHVTNRANVTKSWVPTTSRCGGRDRPPPRFRLVDDSTYLKHFPVGCPFTTQRVERVGGTIYCRTINQLSWAEYERNISRDPLSQRNEKINMEFSSRISIEGILYVLTLQGSLVTVETIDSRGTITGVASNRAVPSLNCRIFEEYLVEIGGEIFVIFLIHQKSLGIVDFVEVFRLCLRGLKWIKAGMIGGKVIFLDPIYVWGNSAEIGCKGDCIYFTQASYSGWLVYDMKSCSISYV